MPRLIKKLTYCFSLTIFFLISVINYSFSKSNKQYTTQEIDSIYLLIQNKTQYVKEFIDDINIVLNYGIQKKDKLREAKGLFLLGKYNLIVNKQYEIASQKLTKSLSIFDSLRNEEGINLCYLQLGIVRYNIKDYNEAIYYFNKIIQSKTYKKSKATPYYLSALSLSEINKFDKAITYFDIAIKEYYKKKDSTGVGMCQMFIGKMYNNKKEYKKAKEHLLKIIGTPVNRKDSFSFSPAYAFVSTSYFYLKDYKTAIKYAQFAHDFLKNIDGSINYYTEALRTLNKAHAALGNDKVAYYYLNELISLNDSTINLNIINGISKIKSQYEYQQKLNEAKLAQVKKDLIIKQEIAFQKQVRNSFILGFSIVLLFAMVIYNQRNKIKKSKQRSDELLLNILPYDVAEELKENGFTEAKQFESVTVVFTDFKGFTEISQALSPKELVQLINEHFSEFDKIMKKHGIEKIKTIGDSYMAVGGLPITNNTHAFDVINAAIEIQEYLENINKIKKEKSEKYFEARIGIHTGSVVAGIVGLNKFSYDIWGDTVNTASRIENNCEVGKINVSGSTYELLKKDFNFEFRGKIEVKGKGMVDMYYLNQAIKG